MFSWAMKRMRNKCAFQVLQLPNPQLEYSNWYSNCSTANWSTLSIRRICSAKWLFYKEVFAGARGGNQGKRIGVMRSSPVLSLHEWGIGWKPTPSWSTLSRKKWKIFICLVLHNTQ